MAEGVGHLVEGQMQLVQLLGRFVVGQREGSTRLALLDNFLQRFV